MLYAEEQAKRKELEEKYSQGKTDENQEYLTQVKALLREKEPNLEQLMALSLKKEREQQERKDAKVLEILRVKDKILEDLQNKLVSSEAEYGKLATLYQEQKKKLRMLEEQEEGNQRSRRDLEEALETFRVRVETFEKGKEYRRMLEVEDQLKEATQIITRYQQELANVNQKLSEKLQIESLYEEALQRAKEQIRDKESEIQHMTHELSQERDSRMREQETSKLL